MTAMSQTERAGRPVYQPYLDGRPVPFRWRLGLRALDPDDWLQVTEHYDHEVALKARYSDEFPDTTLRFLPGTETEGQEVLTAVAAHLRARDPRRFADVTDDPGARHPLDAAGRLVQEDLILLVERGGAMVCGGGSVCFPNRWDLASKLGRTMAEVHAPVAQLNAQLESPIDRFMERLEPDKSFWRLGYSLIDTDELYQATDGTAAPRGIAVEPAEWWLRVERETLRRMPGTRCILFTIHSYLSRLSDLAGTDDGHRLAEAIEAMPADVQAYKSIAAIVPEAAAYLRT